ncbi:MAG: hypothetical protein JWN46_2261 [Acidimicrobiales bacterium]|nr:hypothetical protein [Acidimicrobiales bacterium]
MSLAVLAVFAPEVDELDRVDHRMEASPDILKHYWVSPARPARNLDPSALLRKALS